MAIAFSCEKCGKAFQVAATLAGRKARCKNCGQMMRIPAGSPQVLPIDIGDDGEGDPAPLPPRGRGKALPSRPMSHARPGAAVQPVPKVRVDSSLAVPLGVLALSLALVGLAAFATFVGGAETRVFGLTLGMIGLGWVLWGALWTLITPVEMSVSRLAIIPINLVRTGYLIRFLFESWKNDIRPLGLILAGFAAFFASQPFVPRGGHAPGDFGRWGRDGGEVRLPIPPQPERDEPPPKQSLPPSQLRVPILEPGPELAALPHSSEAGPSLESDRLVELRGVLGNNPRELFRDAAPRGAVLVGVRVSYGPQLDMKNIGSVQPIYRMGDRHLAGPRFGNQQGEQIEVVAEPGYAVGALRTHTGIKVDGFDLVFMRFDGKGLDPSEAKASPWIGDPQGGYATYVVTEGQPVVGIMGRCGDQEVYALSLLGLKP